MNEGLPKSYTVGELIAALVKMPDLDLEVAVTLKGSAPMPVNGVDDSSEDYVVISVNV